jgi:RNA polymerase sigma-70 factor (ECF subfamily)
MSQTPDAVLVARALQGEHAAFRQIVENTQSMVYNLAYRFMRNQHDAEDITQEVYVRLFRNLKKYREEIKLTTWLYKITTNCCLDMLKTSRSRQSFSTMEKVQLFDSQDPQEVMERFEVNALVLHLAEKLTPVQKAVFILRDLEGLTVIEVEKVLSMKKDTIKSNLYYARKRMSELLQPYKTQKI